MGKQLTIQDIIMGKTDMVNHPPHYTSGSIEVIDMMERVYGKASLELYCEINSFKYKMRAGRKGDPLEDLAKAAWYEDKAASLRQSLSGEVDKKPID